jgi:hypothetical protein
MAVIELTERLLERRHELVAGSRCSGQRLDRVAGGAPVSGLDVEVRVLGADEVAQLPEIRGALRCARHRGAGCKAGADAARQQQRASKYLHVLGDQPRECAMYGNCGNWQPSSEKNVNAWPATPARCPARR